MKKAAIALAFLASFGLGIGVGIAIDNHATAAFDRLVDGLSDGGAR